MYVTITVLMVIVQYGLYSCRIFVSKLFFFAFLGLLMFILWENGGVQIFRPLDHPVGGVFGPGGPETDNIISYANNEPIFVIVVPILWFLKTTNPLMTFSN